MTPEEARSVLREQADRMRARPRSWPASSKGRRSVMADAMLMAANDSEHLWRVADLDDAALQRMLDSGWDPRDRGSPDRNRTVS